MMNRKEFYEMLVDGFTADEFKMYFRVDPIDIMSFDYNFENVKWNFALETAYNEYCESEV